ncbi:hypothetical protein KFL_001570080 [Klebsormidium nitens]|uniref:Beta-lactamase-related domain-containing protein n=1 Tax=Klebsormidium nitens TaxID=105231 RepID=A0A0U9HKL0_KLENI|nr:hypothetical protein KFL_001570080 [Klebsormidium nitens]|eukprot:GAQ83669.1 hypothetical protein KFL_001570080 [Klebsormidium nitens]
MAATWRLRRALPLLLCLVSMPGSFCDGRARTPVQQAGQLDTGEEASALLESVPGYLASVLCDGLFISDRTLASLLSSEGCLLGCALLPELLATNALSYTVDGRRKSVTARAGHVVVTATAPRDPSRQPFSCLVKTSAQVGPVVRPVYRSNGSPYRRFDWPEARGGTSSEFSGVDYGRLAAAIAPFFADPMAPNSVANATETRAVVVIYQGKIIAERYAESLGFFETTPLLGWSMGKSLTSALVGLRIGDGALNLTDLANPRAWSPAEVAERNITVADLLHQTSGIRWNESSLPGSDANRVTFGLAQNDTEMFVVARPQAVPAGTRFDYSTGNVQLLQGQLRRSFRGNDVAYWSYPYNRLFKPIGARSFKLSFDGVGTIQASSSVYATARDWARLGQLYLQDGVWDGTRILPRGWVRYSRTPSSPSVRHVCGPVSLALGLCAPYGALWWVAPLKGVSAAAYAAEGFEGQYVVVVPDQELVVVQLGWARNDALDDYYAGVLVRHVSEAVPRGKSPRAKNTPGFSLP